MKCVALCSGGVDSSAAVAVAMKEDRMEVVRGVHFLRKGKEFEADYAQKVADRLGFPLKVIEVPVTRWIRQMQETKVEYLLDGLQKWELLMGRNIIYLTLIANLALSVGASVIVIGAAPHDADPTGTPQDAHYPDCHPVVLKKYENLINMCIHRTTTPYANKLRIYAPLFSRVKDKVDVFRLGLKYGIRPEDTITCYRPFKQNGEWHPCGSCPPCILRKYALEKLKEEGLL